MPSGSVESALATIAEQSRFAGFIHPAPNTRRRLFKSTDSLRVRCWQLIVSGAAIQRTRNQQLISRNHFRPIAGRLPLRSLKTKTAQVVMTWAAFLLVASLLYSKARTRFSSPSSLLLSASPDVLRCSIFIATSRAKSARLPFFAFAHSLFDK